MQHNDSPPLKDFLRDYQALAKDVLFPFMDPKSLLALFRACRGIYRAFWAEMAPKLRVIIEARDPVKVLTGADEQAKRWLLKAHGNVATMSKILGYDCQPVDVMAICRAIDYMYPGFIKHGLYRSLPSAFYKVANYNVYLALLKSEFITGGNAPQDIIMLAILDDINTVSALDNDLDQGRVDSGKKIRNFIRHEKIEFLSALVDDFATVRQPIAVLTRLIMDVRLREPAGAIPTPDSVLG